MTAKELLRRPEECMLLHYECLLLHQSLLPSQSFGLLHNSHPINHARGSLPQDSGALFSECPTQFASQAQCGGHFVNGGDICCEFVGAACLGISSNEGSCRDVVHSRATLLHGGEELLGLADQAMAGVHVQQRIVGLQHIPAHIPNHDAIWHSMAWHGLVSYGIARDVWYITVSHGTSW